MTILFQSWHLWILDKSETLKVKDPIPMILYDIDIISDKTNKCLLLLNLKTTPTYIQKH